MPNGGCPLGARLRALRQLERRFDPGNLFRMNLNIEPAGGVTFPSAGTPVS
jgi:hypothetical protein